MLNQAQKTEYLAGGGVKCPYCKSENISQGAFWDAPTDSLGATVTCKDCKQSWGDIYTLTDVVEVAT